VGGTDNVPESRFAEWLPVPMLTLLAALQLSAPGSIAVTDYAVQRPRGAQAPRSSQSGVPLTRTTGAFGVGREFLHLVDPARTDSLSLRSDKKREFLAVVWYPAARPVARRSPWMPRRWLDSAASDLAFFARRATPPPSYAEARRIIAATTSTASDSAPVAPGADRFPVVLFAPGNNTSPIYYSAIAEELASHGYVVIGHVPVGWTRSVTCPDGRVAGYHPYPTLEPWIADLRAILDWLPSWDADPKQPFAGRLDLSRISAYGHSAGGNAVEALAARDDRVKSVLLLDPGITDTTLATTKPTLLLLAENRAFLSRPRNAALAAQLIRERAAFTRHLAHGFRLTIVGGEHMLFADISAVPAFFNAPDAPQQLAAAQAVVVAFFDETLRGVRSALIRGKTSKFPVLRVDAGASGSAGSAD